MLEPYGGDYLKTPNFMRLAEKSVTFETHYVGSMPCMPARRDMQSGRLAFLHRSWGPMEPFDNSTNVVGRTAAILTKGNIITSVAGGGDTVAALNNAGVAGGFSYVSIAGGALVEWLEGKKLPGLNFLENS